ncbi:hypothetical protein FRB99_008147 [Tulasnella sp. 403]|nr:hypothetical protein FRB99_008147 [Tulasnella sp. 403]
MVIYEEPAAEVDDELWTRGPDPSPSKTAKIGRRLSKRGRPGNFFGLGRWKTESSDIDYAPTAPAAAPPPPREPTPPPTPPPPPPPEKTPVFDGSAPASIDTFLSTIHRIAFINGFNQNQKVTYAIRCLRGDAMAYVLELKESKTPIATWDEFRRALLSRYLRISFNSEREMRDTRGCIMVIDAEDGRTHGYVSSIPTANLCHDRSDALVVSLLAFGSLDGPFQLKMLNYQYGNSGKEFGYLGLMECEDSYFALQPCTKGSEPDLVIEANPGRIFRCRSTARADFDSLASAAIWFTSTIEDEAYQELHAMWQVDEDGAGLPLEFKAYLIRDATAALPLSDAYTPANSYNAIEGSRSANTRSLIPGGYHNQSSYGGYNYSYNTSPQGGAASTVSDKGKGLIVCRPGSEPTSTLFANLRTVRLLLQ